MDDAVAGVVIDDIAVAVGNGTAVFPSAFATLVFPLDALVLAAAADDDAEVVSVLQQLH